MPTFGGSEVVTHVFEGLQAYETAIEHVRRPEARGRRVRGMVVGVALGRSVFRID